MLIECPFCEARVDGKVLAEHVAPSDGVSDQMKFQFLECPSCFNVMVGQSEWLIFDSDESGWTAPTRVWPEPPKHFDHSVPWIVRESIEDAKKCYNAKVFMACAVMCGRAIEAICVEKTGEKTLHKGLQSLKTAGIIDERIFNWGDALRKERNIGAHATEETVRKVDAGDILDFTIAITEYVYEMAAKFDAYQSRKSKRESRKGKTESND